MRVWVTDAAEIREVIHELKLTPESHDENSCSLPLPAWDMNHPFSSSVSTLCLLPTHNSVTVLCYHSTGIIGPRNTQLRFLPSTMLSWKTPARIVGANKHK